MNANTDRVAPGGEHAPPVPGGAMHGGNGPFRVRLTCCGYDDGSWAFPTWAAADALRESYLAVEGHDRSAIIETDDHEPQPSDGPDYHAEHEAWATRNGRSTDLCTGSDSCCAVLHVHGCWNDRGSCDHPDEHHQAPSARRQDGGT